MTTSSFGNDGPKPTTVRARSCHDARLWHGLWVILFVVAVRCMVSADPFPGWSGDPLVMESPITGLTPAFSVGLDVLTLLGAGWTLLACARRGWRPRAWELGLFVLGAGAVAVHALTSGRATVENITIGCQWLAAFGAGLACVQACRDAEARRAVIATLLGVAVFVALKGGHQVFVEHGQTYADFKANKAAILGAHGWSEGSAMALAYERRVSQADPLAWFGLANVFATVMAAGMTVSLGMGGIGLLGRMGRIGLMGREPRGAMIAVTAAGALFAGGVWLSHSKGGVAAALLGVGLLGAGVVWSRGKWRVSGHVLGVMCAVLPFAAVAAVVLRGVIGERLGELSLLFRWFYLEGAARVVAESPLLGVGPDGFKEAYLRLKPALSPEEVSSPHSWYVDLIATLGLGGWAWAAWVISQLYRAGAGLAVAAGAREEAADSEDAGIEVKRVFLLLAVAMGASALFEQRLATVDTTVLRVVSLVVATGVAWGVVKVAHGLGSMGFGVALAAGALAAVTHCQIEMTGITPGAAMWVLLLLGAGAGLGLSGQAARMASSSTVRGMAGAAVVFCAGLVPAVAFSKVVYWDLQLREAARVVSSVPDLDERLRAIAAGRPRRGDSIESLARDLSQALGQAVGATPSGVTAGMAQVRLKLIDQASRELLKARNAGAWDFQTARALSRLRLLVALAQEDPGKVLEQAPMAESVIHTHMDATGVSASGWAWIGTMRRSVYERTRGAAEGRAAVDAFARAAELSPYEPMYRVEAARLEAGLGNAEAAAKWAAAAIRLSENLRLDPVRQLAGRDLAEMKRLAGEP